MVSPVLGSPSYFAVNPPSTSSTVPSRSVRLGHAEVVLPDLLNRLGAVELARTEGADLLGPQRPPEGESRVPACRSRGEPAANDIRTRSCSQDDAGDSISASCPGRRRDLAALLWAVEALELPEVRLDPRGAQLFHRGEDPAHGDLRQD